MITISRKTGRTFPTCKIHGFLFLLSLLGAIVTAQAQRSTGTITGRVLDASSDSYLRSAEVQIAGGDLARTEQGGFYSFLGMQPGQYTITFSYAGFLDETRNVTVLEGQTVHLDVTMHRIRENVRGETVAEAIARSRTEEPIIELEKLTISTGRVIGSNKAFMDQKSNMNMTTVVATTDFGESTTGNIADFLGNLPGISVGFDDADASTISIGGMDAKYVGVTMDGASVASGAKGSFDGNTRAFQFDTVSIDSIESIEVAKTVSADMDGDAPAGMVRMRTKSGFDRKSAQLSYSLNMRMNTYAMTLDRTIGPSDGYSRKTFPNMNIQYSTPLARNSMALMFNAGWRETYTPYSEMTNTYSNWNGNIPFVTRVEYRDAPQYKRNTNLGVRYDYRLPLGRISISAEYQTEITDKSERTVRFVTGGANVGTNVESSSLTYFESRDSSNTYLIEPNNKGRSYKHGDFWNFTLNFENRFWSRFKVDAMLAYNRQKTTTEWSDRDFFSHIAMRSSRFHDLIYASRSSGRSTDWVFVQGPKGVLPEDTNQIGQPGTATSAANDSLLSKLSTYGQDGTGAIKMPMNQWLVNQMPQVAANLEWAVPFVERLTFKTGVKGSGNYIKGWQPDSSVVRTLQFHGPVEDLPVGAIVGNSSANAKLTDYQTRFHFDPPFGGNIGDMNIPFIDREALYSTYLQHPEWFYESLSSRNMMRRAMLTGDQNLRELVGAGYFMGTWVPIARIRMQAGLRYEYTDQAADTLIAYTRGQMINFGWGPEYADDPDYIDLQYKNGERTRITNKFGNMLTSASMKYDFTPNFNAHIAFADGVGRVDVNKIAGRWTISDSAATAKAPNPKLSPEKFKTYSASLEYYFEPAGTFNITYYYRTWSEQSGEWSDITGESEINMLKESYDPALIDYFIDNGYTLQSFVDSDREGRRMQSLEISYRQRIPFIPGLFAQASFTRNIPNWRKLGAASAPKLATLNITYGRRQFNINVNARWTDRYWTSIDKSLDLANRGNFAVFTLNAQLTYRLSSALSFVLYGDNLTNDRSETFENNSGALQKSAIRGTTITFGIRGSF